LDAHELRGREKRNLFALAKGEKRKKKKRRPANC